MAAEELCATQPDARSSRYAPDSESKNAVIDALKQRIQKLETENKELRMQVKVVYGELHLLSKK